MNSFGTEYEKLNSHQRQAVDEIEGPVMVIAGPGTGKTQLLSLRVANILRRTDTSPGSILCLTYTESGQQAMLERLAGLLGEQAKRIEVHTFHGFGSHLITRFPEYFPELVHFRPADDLALYETLFSCLSRLPRNNPLSKMSYGQFFYQADAANRISQLKQAGITPTEARQRAEADNQWCRAVGRRVVTAFNKAGRLSPKVLPGLTAELEVLVKQIPDAGVAQACISELDKALVAGADSGKTAELSAFKKRWLTTEDGNLYFKPTDQLKKLQALTELYEAYETELRERKLYDYDDMILYALERLKNDKDFRATLQETYHYILADEYQDTNGAQASIITLIADNPVNEGRPNIMVVGDDDQAIYGFQGALGDVMRHFRERWQDVKTITLKDNYRSTQAIIDLARSLISRGRDRLENYYEDIDKSLSSRAVHLPQAPVQIETTSPEAVLDKAVLTAKSANGEQLAFIASKHKYLQGLADRLDAAGIKYYYEGREDLLADERLTGLLLIAETALAIRQKDLKLTDYTLPEIFARGWLSIERVQAWEIALMAKAEGITWWEALTASESARTTEASTRLTAAAAGLDPRDATLSLRFLAKQARLRLAKKLDQLVAHASTYYARDKISLAELIQYTKLCNQAGIGLNDPIAKGTRKAGITLLSAHKSKGLEFDRVHMLHADYHTWFKEKGRRNNIVLPPGWDFLEPTAETEDDRLRLLYVAMTRAKQELQLIRSTDGKRSESLPGAETIKTLEHVSEQLAAFEESASELWQAWYLPHNQTERQKLLGLLKPALADYRLSPSHLTRFLDVARGGPALFLTGTMLGIPEPVNPEARFGSYVHRALNYAQDYLNRSGKLPDQAKLQEALRQDGGTLTDTLLEDVVRCAADFLEHTDVIRPGGVGEFSFSTRNLTMDDIRLTGNVDNYLQEADKLTITDYKTGRALNSWRVTEDYYKQKLHRFRQQLLFYELLFRLDKNFNRITSTSLQVAFVEPSRRDVYYCLTLDPDDQERQRLKDLAERVWQHITTADFPSTAAYDDSYEGLTAFEADLLNG